MHIVVDARIRRSSTGRYADRLLKHLQEIDQNNKYTVLLEGDDDWQPTSKNFKVLRVSYKQFSFSLFEQIGFARTLYKLKPDVVHFTMTQQPIFYFGPIVTTTHDLTMLNFVRSKGQFYLTFWLKQVSYRFMLWWSHRKSKRIIVPTKYVLKDVLSFHKFTAGKVFVTYEASEPEISGSIKPVDYVKRPFILYVGSAFPHKNLKKLIDAFYDISYRYKDLQLVLAGKEEYYYKELIQYAQNTQTAHRIIFTGYVDDSKLKWLYKNAEAYVFPSLSEGFGLPGLEAMVHGCPVISSNATCLPEVYGDSALYFDPQNAADIAATISKILEDNSIRKDLIRKGYVQAKKYSWQEMAKQTLYIYQKVEQIGQKNNHS